MKVLIISHNPITTYNSMGRTFLGLFSSFSKEELCQLYIYPTIPNIDKCISYFRITDKEVLKSVLPWNKTGKIINKKDINYDNLLYEKENDSVLYTNKQKHKIFKLLCRSTIWKLGKWYSKNLNQWITNEKPDVIFAAPGLSAFFYNIITKISKKFHLPIVLYVCDDFYFSSLNKKNNHIFENYYYKYLRKKIKNIISLSKIVVSISKPMEKLYAKEFGCNAVTIFSGTTFPFINPDFKIIKDVVRYFGNLKLGRDKSLIEIGMALDKLNTKHNKNYKLEIYSMDNFSSDISNISCIKHMGFTESDKLFDLMKSSSLLLHVESFDYEYLERTKFSISTKIPDILATGIPLLAYGPKEIASIKHLEENNCAFLVNDTNMLLETLEKALLDKNKRLEVSYLEMEVAKKFHSNSKQSALLKEVIINSIDNK